MTAEALGAWATAIGVLVALSFGVIAERRTRQDRNALAQQSRRAQASRVSAWVASERLDRHSARAVLVVQNASDEPVWDVVVSYMELGDELPDGTLAEHDVTWRLGVLPPQTTRTMNAPWTPPEDDEPLALSFRDNANSRWKRRADAFLEQSQRSTPK